MKNSATKKVYQGLYIHIKSGKYISLFKGDLSDTWNIFNDRELCDEFAVGYFQTKWQCVEYLDSLTK